MPDFLQTFNRIGMSAFGMAMPVLSPTWARATPTYDAEALSLRVDDGWVSPCATIATKIAAAAELRVTLISASGTPITSAGLLLALPPQLHLRLRRIYAAVFSGDLRPVPRWFFYAGAVEADTDGMFDARDALGRGGVLTIHDSDGMPINPLAVAGAFAAILEAHHILTPDETWAAPTELTRIAELGGTTPTMHVRLSDFAGRPVAGSHFRGLTRVANGIYSVTSGATIDKEEASEAFRAEERDRLLIGPATTGVLGDSFRLPAAATLPRDFLSLRVVELTPFLVGAPNSGFRGTQLERRPQVRIREALTLLADGNEVLGAGNAALDGADQGLVVAQAIRSRFLLPANAATSHWPAFPAGGATDAAAPLPLELGEGFVHEAQFLLEDGQPRGDVVLTLRGLPANVAVRVYNRKFLPDAREGRGDGAGGVTDAAGTVTMRLSDPFGLRRQPPGDPVTAVTLPSPGTLHLDMIVVRRNAERNARVYGNVVAVIQATATTSTAPPEPPANAFDAGPTIRRGVCNAGILGLGRSIRDLPSDPGEAARVLAGETADLRSQSRLPTMARREILVAGRASSAWRAVVSGGRLTEETVNADARLGCPGGMGGRETQTTGVATQGGVLAYDLARMAFRRTTNIIERIEPLVDAGWNQPETPASGRFAAAALQTVAPYCETPELGLLRGLLDTIDPTLIPASIESFVEWVAGQIGVGSSSVWPQVQSAIAGLGGADIARAAERLYEELRRELISSCYGRRDAQWALAGAIQRARRFIYIETPGFCSTAALAAADHAANLIDLISARLGAAPGLHVIVCLPRFPDVAPGYEPIGAYEVADRLTLLSALQTSGVGDRRKSRVVPFHTVGFPGRPSRLETTTVIVDDVWALVGASTFRRRGLTFDGSADVVLTDTQLEQGRSPAIRDFRRRLMAARLGADAQSEGMRAASYARLDDGVEAFYAIKDILVAGGLGRIELPWTGEVPDTPPPSTSNIELANPEGQEFADTSLLRTFQTQLADAIAGAALPP